MTEHYTPKERIEFFDVVSNREMMLAEFHSGGLWLFYKHPDGQWVSLRQATLADITLLVGNTEEIFKRPGLTRRPS